MRKITIRLPEKVRGDLRGYADDHELTYSEALLDLLPEDVEAEVIDRGESVMIDVNESAHERLDALSGDGVDYADVVAHFLYRELEDDE